MINVSVNVAFDDRKLTGIQEDDHDALVFENEVIDDSDTEEVVQTEDIITIEGEHYADIQTTTLQTR